MLPRIFFELFYNNRKFSLFFQIFNICEKSPIKVVTLDKARFTKFNHIFDLLAIFIKTSIRDMTGFSSHAYNIQKFLYEKAGSKNW